MCFCIRPVGAFAWRLSFELAASRGWVPLSAQKNLNHNFLRNSLLAALLHLQHPPTPPKPPPYISQSSPLHHLHHRHHHQHHHDRLQTPELTRLCYLYGYR